MSVGGVGGPESNIPAQGSQGAGGPTGTPNNPAHGSSIAASDGQPGAPGVPTLSTMSAEEVLSFILLLVRDMKKDAEEQDNVKNQEVNEAALGEAEERVSNEEQQVFSDAREAGMNEEVIQAAKDGNCVAQMMVASATDTSLSEVKVASAAEQNSENVDAVQGNGTEGTQQGGMSQAEKSMLQIALGLFGLAFVAIMIENKQSGSDSTPTEDQDAAKAGTAAAAEQASGDNPAIDEQAGMIADEIASRESLTPEEKAELQELIKKLLQLAMANVSGAAAESVGDSGGDSALLGAAGEG